MLYILHQVNCQDRFGYGFAGYLKDNFPQAEDAYHKHFHTSDYGNWSSDCWLKERKEVLGTYSKAEGDGFAVINIYGQFFYGNARKSGQCYTDYEALEEAISSFREDHPNDTAICPQFMSCGLAGGDWKKVKTILTRYNIIPCDKIDLINRVYHIAK